MWDYFRKWIKNFSKKIRPLTHNTTFPLDNKCFFNAVFNSLKFEVENSIVCSTDELLLFQVETDVSEFEIDTALAQNSQPVAFFSLMLNASELKHSAVEKEASAIIKAVHKWKHYLTERHFTNQKSVLYMFNTKHHGKIKNDKIM